MKSITRSCFLISIFVLMIMPSRSSAQQDSTLFFEAKALMFQQKYQDALNLYELLRIANIRMIQNSGLHIF